MAAHNKLYLLALVILIGSLSRTGFAQRKTENVILFMSDGVRWQEVFRGAEETLISKDKGGVSDIGALRKAYWRDNVEDRRKALMPFVWNIMAGQGQLYGNRDKG